MCGRPERAVARVGSARSLDQGRTWEDLGVVLEAATDSIACDSPNRYVIGGVGDLSVMLNAAKTDLYIFFSQYQRQVTAQGVAVARLVWANRDRPTGRVTVWTDDAWVPSRINRMPAEDVYGMTRRIWRDTRSALRFSRPNSRGMTAMGKSMRSGVPPCTGTRALSVT